jgi:hypothetical protein
VHDQAVNRVRACIQAHRQLHCFAADAVGPPRGAQNSNTRKNDGRVACGAAGSRREKLKKRAPATNPRGAEPQLMKTNIFTHQ